MFKKSGAKTNAKKSFSKAMKIFKNLDAKTWIEKVTRSLGDTENLKTHLIEDTPSAGVTLRWSTESTKETRKTK